MMSNKNIFSWLDQALDFFFRPKPEHEQKFVELRQQVNGKEHILYDMGIIDSKSSALLTHVSIMLAVVAMLIQGEDETLWKIIMTAELLGFSFTGMILLRCVDVMGPPYKMLSEDYTETNTMYQKEVLRRRGIYQYMLRSVFVLTVILVVLIVIKTAFLS